MKLTPNHKKLIEHLYCVGNWKSPLEIAAELGLTFHQVCDVIEKNHLKKMDISVAVNILKATRANTYQAKTWAWGDEHSTRIGAAVEANWRS